MNTRYQQYVAECWDERLDGLHFDKEKFAELIAKDARQQAINGMHNMFMIMHESVNGVHNYWHVAANLIISEYSPNENC